MNAIQREDAAQERRGKMFPSHVVAILRDAAQQAVDIDHDSAKQPGLRLDGAVVVDDGSLGLRYQSGGPHCVVHANVEADGGRIRDIYHYKVGRASTGWRKAAQPFKGWY